MKSKTRAWGALLFSGLYLLNPGLGIFEFIPDTLPLIGNLDEAAATALFLWAVKELRTKPIEKSGP